MASDVVRNPPSLQQGQNAPQDGVENEEGRKRIRTFNAQHTLDSDEEYEKETADQQNRLDAKAARQYSERRTILNDDGIKISPFNLKEELRTGHFDRDGTYVFKKQRRRVGRMDEPVDDNDDDDDDDDIQDAWLEGVDWASIKSRETDAIKAIKPVKRSFPADEADIDADAVEHDSLAEQDNDAVQMGFESEIVHASPGSNSPAAGVVASRPILRSNDSEPKTSNHRVKWAAYADNKQPPSTVTADDGESASMPDDDRFALYRKIVSFMQPGETVTKSIQRLGRENKDSVTLLTGFIGELVDEGEYEMYDWTYEKLQHLITVHDAVPSVTSGETPDMFSDEFAEDTKVPHGTALPQTAAVNSSSATSSMNDKLVCWLYKWENADAAPTYGPFSSEQMQQWSDAGHFGTGVWVRRNDADVKAPFYTSKRVDFDLYT